MKWIGISGGWRKTNKEVEQIVRREVSKIMRRGDGIVSGSALGVDSIALDEALKNNPNASRIKILLPTYLKNYAAHYRRRANEGVITRDQAEELIKQLIGLRDINTNALVENPIEIEEITKEHYYDRNLEVVKKSDSLLAFHIRSEKSEGLGTQDTIEKARLRGIPVKVVEFDLTK